MEESKVSMFGTKLEVVMRKAEPGSWSKLGKPIPSEAELKAASEAARQAAEQKAREEAAAKEAAEVDVLDLDDLELSGNTKMVLSPEASGGRTRDICEPGQG